MRAPETATDLRFPASASLREARALLARAFAEAGLDAPALEARRLLSAATRLSEEDQLRDPARELSADQRDTLWAFAIRRLNREPLGRIVGTRSFYGLDIRLGDQTLEPRDDSEILVTTALERIAGKRSPRILDAGTGSGCLLLALLANAPGAWGMGIDVSAGAIATARDNAMRLGFGDRAAFAVGDWLSGVAGRFDLIVANPPYVRRGDIAGLAPEVSRFDPRGALDGGIDGLDHYRVLVPQALECLAAGGVLVLEIGADQADMVGALVSAAGLEDVVCVRDLGGRDRVLTARGPDCDAAYDKNPLGMLTRSR